jgi:hypothetical protein
MLHMILNWSRRYGPFLLLAVMALVLLYSVDRFAAAQEPVVTEAWSVADMEAALRAVPVFSRFDSPALPEIFAAGQALGNRANVFTTVGDSNTSNGDFLRPFGLPQPNICRYGPYAPLRRTVEYFSVSPRPGYRNSFTNDSLAAEIGFGTPMVLDPFWADQSMCERNESPLMCEFRIVRPSVAIIMLGQVDNNQAHLSVEDYAINMETIIQSTIAQGVIPVVTTIVFLPERVEYARSLEYNLALVHLTEQYDIPLINLWAAVQTLPNSGIGPDHSHLSARVGDFCGFDGAEQQLGGTLRNLLTLQALDELRQRVLAVPHL